MITKCNKRFLTNTVVCNDLSFAKIILTSSQLVVKLVVFCFQNNGQVSQFCESPGSSHWDAVKRILAYLQGTSTFGIRFGGVKSDLIGFSDSDYAGDVDTRQSTSGFVFMLHGGPVAWSSQRQSCVALSTTEAEFIAACEATKEGVWLQRLVSEVVPDWKPPFKLMCDNQSAIRLIKNPEFHQRSKHIAVRYHLQLF